MKVPPWRREKLVKPHHHPLCFSRSFMPSHGVCPSLKCETFHWFALGSLSNRQTSAQSTRKHGLSVLYLSEQGHNSAIAKVIHLCVLCAIGIWKVKFARTKNKRYRLLGCSQVRGGLQQSYSTFPLHPTPACFTGSRHSDFFTSVALFTYHSI